MGTMMLTSAVMVIGTIILMVFAPKDEASKES